LQSRHTAIVSSEIDSFGAIIADTLLSGKVGPESVVAATTSAFVSVGSTAPVLQALQWQTHAWIGIIMGGMFTVIWGLAIVSLILAMIAQV
jgi:hypothetical protein